MSIRPIDFKTTLYNAEDASRTRENQKGHEAGIAGNPALNKSEAEEKAQTVQQTEEAEGSKIKKEDEQKQREHEQKERERKKKEEAKKEKPKIPDGIHFKIDLRA